MLSLKDKEIKLVEIEVLFTLGEPEKGPGIPHGTTRVIVQFIYCTLSVQSGTNRSLPVNE